MPTPMESNTLGLQEILRTVNALPTAESSGVGGNATGGGSGLPLIDLVELGFPDVDGLGYYETVMFDQTTWEILKTKIEYGAVKIKIRQPNGSIGVEGFLCIVYDTGGGNIQYMAEKTSGSMRLNFTLSPGNGQYGAQFFVAGS